MVALVVRPLAEADIDEAFAWYEQRSISLGVEFLRAVDNCFDAIREAACVSGGLSKSSTQSSPTIPLRGLLHRGR